MSCVLHDACPVPFFGDPLAAQIATVSINPSYKEFQDAGGRMRTDDRRRLPTLASLQIAGWDEATDDTCSQIAAACSTYFERNPYHWFNSLNSMLTKTGRGTFYGGGACHLDLVPWATDPIWRKVSTNDKRLLREHGRPTLHSLLASMSVEALLLNGQTVVDEFRRVTGDQLGGEYVPDWETKTGRGCRWRGTITEIGDCELQGPVQVLGWNWNLPGSHIGDAVKDSILDWAAGTLG